MRIEWSWDFQPEELKAIAAHLGRTVVDDDEVRRFLRASVGRNPFVPLRCFQYL